MTEKMYVTANMIDNNLTIIQLQMSLGTLTQNKFKILTIYKEQNFTFGKTEVTQVLALLKAHSGSITIKTNMMNALKRKHSLCT